MRYGYLPIMIINWIWYLSTILKDSYNFIHYASLILASIFTILVFRGEK